MEAISKLKPERKASDRRRAAGAALVIVLAVAAAYRGSLSGPFLFDDLASIRDNPTLRHLWPLSTPLAPPIGHGLTVTGRPVLNLSLALNYAWGGLAVRGYHLANLAIHAGAALALFGLLRRTLGRTALSLGIALLWALHPLQTEAVTYVVQRAESLMGLFYLVTLYCFVRGVQNTDGAARENFWFFGSFSACLLGMGTKEVMATAPVVVLLYDRVFLSGSFRTALSRRWRVHAGLAGTWLLLAAELASAGGNRGGSAGFGSGAGWGAYVLTQFRAIAVYLRLALWPHPLIFDHGTFWVGSVAEILPQAIVVCVLLAASAWALGRPRWAGMGFLGAAFFLVLAPTSLVPGATQMIVEHRMYLPLAAVLTAVVLGLEAVLRNRAVPLTWIAVALAAVACGALTARRNADYRSATALWGDTAAKQPDNPSAQNDLGVALVQEGRFEEAVAHYREALRLRPGFAEAENNLGIALVQTGRAAEALPHYEQALRLEPGYAEAESGFGTALVQAGRPQEAVAHFERAIRLKPGAAEAHGNLGIALARLNRLSEAVAEDRRALVLAPDDVQAHVNLGNALYRGGRPGEAAEQYAAALRLNPDLAQVQNNLGILLAQAGRTEEAIAHFEAAVRSEPGFAEARHNLAIARGPAGK